MSLISRLSCMNLISHTRDCWALPPLPKLRSPNVREPGAPVHVCCWCCGAVMVLHNHGRCCAVPAVRSPNPDRVRSYLSRSLGALGSPCGSVASCEFLQFSESRKCFLYPLRLDTAPPRPQITRRPRAKIRTRAAAHCHSRMTFMSNTRRLADVHLVGALFEAE